MLTCIITWYRNKIVYGRSDASSHVHNEDGIDSALLIAAFKILAELDGSTIVAWRST